ncbi:MMPL family transporter [Methylomagnum sp.]
MKAILTWIPRHPWLVALILLLITAAFVPGLQRLVIDPSSEGMMVADDPDKVYYDQTKATFGDDTLISIVMTSDNVFSPKCLRAVWELTDKLYKVDGVTRVVSLATVRKIKSEGGMLDTNPLMVAVPASDEEAGHIRDDALANEIFLNNVISKDGKTTAINAYLASRPGDPTYNQRVTDAIESMIAEQRAKTGAHIYQIGVPLLKLTIVEYIKQDNKVLGPLSVTLMLGILVYMFRTGIAAVLPIFTGGFAVLWMLGFMGYMGYTINPINATLPTLLLVIGSTEDVHLLSVYADALRTGEEKLKALRNMVLKASLALVLTNITTFLGFASGAINSVVMLKEFSIAASFGIVASLAATLLGVPAALRLLPVPKSFLVPEEAHQSGRFFLWLESVLTDFSDRRRRWTIGIVAVVMALSVAGWFRIEVNSDFVSFLKEGSAVRQSFTDVHEKLAGAQTFYVVVETGLPDGLKHPEVLRDIDKLQNFLNARADKTMSLVDYLKLINRELNDGDPGHATVPDSDELVSQYLLMLDNEDVRRVADSELSKAAIMVRHNITGSSQLNKLLRDTEAFAKTQLSPNLRIRFSGEGILVNHASDAMSAGQVSSLALAIFSIFVLISVLFMSVKVGVLAMIPNLVPISIHYGVMGWFGFPLSPGTISVAVIALGIIVDDTIHLMICFQRELKSTQDQMLALRRTLAHELRPVVGSALALAAGFGILVFSEFGPVTSFAWLAALAMITALLSDLLITPFLIAGVSLISPWDLLRLKISGAVMERSELFKGMSLGDVKRLALLGTVEQYQAGERIVAQGDRGNEMYLILEGAADVMIHANQRSKSVERLGQGAVFGEMTFVTGEPRTADVQAVEPTEVLRVDRLSLEKLRRRYPKIAATLYYNLSAILSRRLEGTTADWLAESLGRTDPDSDDRPRARRNAS